MKEWRVQYSQSWSRCDCIGLWAIDQQCRQSWVPALFQHGKIIGRFYHLGQSAWSEIQYRGSKDAYGDPNNREIKAAVHQILSLEFVPPEQGEQGTFNELQRELPQKLGFAVYFENTYIRRRLARNQAIWWCYVQGLANSFGDGAVTPIHPGRRQCRNPYPVLRARPLGRDRVRCPLLVLEYIFEDNLVALIRAVLFLQI